jgi:glycosyltransferase involved in cell wall biosynthesis
MMVDLTIAIPTYNGANRLPKLLERLQAQVEVEEIKWEIVIIDNNSTDHTSEVIRHFQTTWIGNCVLRYFLEREQGVTFARLCAVREAKGELIGFLDDDILPAPDWVAQAIAFGKMHPQAGAYGGQIHGDFEVKPPENFQKIQGFLAIRERGTEPHLYHPENLSLPPGAALVIRKQAWDESVPNQLVLKGRVNKLKVAGDDFEVLLHIHKAGWEIWYNPTMLAYHQIPHWRLEKDYLLALARGCGLCICQLRFILAKNWQKPIVFLRIFVGGLRRFLKHKIHYQRQVHNNIVALVEIEFFRSSMMSPFYYLNCWLKSFWLFRRCASVLFYRVKLSPGNGLNQNHPRNISECETKIHFNWILICTKIINF